MLFTCPTIAGPKEYREKLEKRMQRHHDRFERLFYASDCQELRKMWRENKMVELNNREKELITNALYILEDQCMGDELHPDIENDLGGTPDPDEVRALMDKIDKTMTSH